MLSSTNIVNETLLNVILKSTNIKCNINRTLLQCINAIDVILLKSIIVKCNINNCNITIDH